MLNYEEFQEYVKNHVKEYMSEAYQGAEVSISQVKKNNGLVLDGLIVKPEGSDVAPTIYLNGFFQKYDDGVYIKEIMEQIGRMTEANMIGPKETIDVAKHFTNFDFVKDKIIMTVVNVKKNADMLVETPHILVEDLALIYKVLLGSEGEGVSTVTIKTPHMVSWGVDVNILHSLAMENSNKLLLSETRNMNDLMLELMGEEVLPDIADMPVENQMFVITNSAKTNGAAAIFYSDALKDLAEKLGTDIYILPSSVHEIIAVSTEMGDPDMLAEMVQEVNGTQVAFDEQLSDHVYYYDAMAEKITIADTNVEKDAKETVECDVAIDMPRRAATRH